MTDTPYEPPLSELVFAATKALDEFWLRLGANDAELLDRINAQAEDIKAGMRRIELLQTQLGKTMAQVATLTERVDEALGVDPEPDPEPEPPEPEPEPPSSKLLVSGPNVGDLPVGARFDQPRKSNNEPATATRWWHPRGADFPGGSMVGNAPVSIAPGSALRVRIAADDWMDPHGKATGSHEVFMPLDEGHRRVEIGAHLNFVDTPDKPWDPGLTGKFFGIANFDQALDPGWSAFPGGGRIDNKHGFFSVRVMQNWWVSQGQESTSRALVTGPPGSHPDRFKNTKWRLGLYVYTSLGDADKIVGVDTATPRSSVVYPYVSNEAHTAEFLCQGFGAPLVNSWLRPRLVVDAGTSGYDGTAELWVGDQRIMRLSGIRYNASGPRSFNFPYASFYIGGNDRRFAPYTPDRAAELLYRNLTVEPVD